MLYPLSLVLNRVLDEEGELAELCEGRIVNIFFLFSQAENHVKEMVAERMVLKRTGEDALESVGRRFALRLTTEQACSRT